MTLHFVDGHAVFGYGLPIDRLPDLFAEFLRRYPDTIDVEILGLEVLEADFNVTVLPQFIISVCRWGGYAGIAARVMKNNSLSDVSSTLREATRHLSSTVPDLALALKVVNGLRGLGKPSFASKHLRFLRPDLCPVLDSVLRDVLPYKYDPAGYAAFSADCRLLARSVSSRALPNPHSHRQDDWLAADVEAALFCHVNQWLP